MYINYGVTSQDASKVYHDKYDQAVNLGWGPRLRGRFQYFTPDEYYEAQIEKLATTTIKWLDVGCGHHIFPSNVVLAQKLANKVQLLVGVDPDENIKDNCLVHEKFQGSVENFLTNQTFDLVTFRMVAEHIVNPKVVMDKINTLTHAGSVVVIYTPNKYALMSFFTRITPIAVHHFFKRILWRTEERDTFSVYFKMNTRKDLQRLFNSYNFQEVHFDYLDDCRTFSRFFVLNYIEIITRTLLHRFGWIYPENCILGVYSKSQ